MKPVLVDTSVWRKYFAGIDSLKGLADLLEEPGLVLAHPFVVGELVLGGLSASEGALFAQLPEAELVRHHEVLAFVKKRKLARRGIGWIDAHLLASALTSSATLWSTDRPLAKLASELAVNFAGSRHLGA